tara:strand:+ start:251 stop:637 length:387 start_codon:yes stop_codon:yes gene_type:complete
MPILKTHNLSVADFTENENIYYLFPDNWSHQKGSNIVRILRDSDHGIALYTGLSPIKPFDEERGMKQLDESLEIVKNILMQKGLVIVLINEFYQNIDYDHGQNYEKEILDSIHEILNIGCPKDVKVTI